jgi:hypothetical protein
MERPPAGPSTAGGRFFVFAKTIKPFSQGCDTLDVEVA